MLQSSKLRLALVFAALSATLLVTTMWFRSEPSDAVKKRRGDVLSVIGSHPPDRPDYPAEWTTTLPRGTSKY
jgi:hypothetical protein